MTGNNEPQITLRYEATPHKPDALKKSQAEAATKLLNALKASLEEIEVGGSEEEVSAVDPNRKNRLLFWSGEPGVGKTSTYVSVRRWFDKSSNINWGDPQSPLARSSSVPVKEQEALFKAIGGLTGKHKRVRWLDALDLELLSGRPNFLAAVLARISDALGTSKNISDSSWTQSGDSERREAEKDFLRLQNDIALSWDGNLRERGHALEPDVYASEVMRAEHARLNVNRRFREVLARLARHVPDCGSKEPALFILPIDDFYLKPDVTLELLRFLRMISSPHLFVLLLGDIEVVEDLLFWHNVGEASRLIQPGGSELLDEPFKENVRQRAMSMATAAIHKLIPTNQQIRIDTMTPEETLSFTVGQNDSIKDLLEQTELKFLAEQVENKTQLLTPGWYLRDALQITPRQAADLHQELIELRKRKEESTGKAQPEPTQEEDEEKWALCGLVAEQVERALLSDARAVPRDSANHILEDMRDPCYLHRWRFPASVVTHKPEPSKAHRFKLSVEDKSDSKSLSPLSQAWLAVLHDLLVHMALPGLPRIKKKLYESRPKPQKTSGKAQKKSGKA